MTPSPVTTLSQFLDALFASGRPVFASGERLPEVPAPELDSALAEVDRRLRAEAPGRAPPLSPAVAVAGAAALARLSQFLVYREIPAERIEQEGAALEERLARAGAADPPGASEHWSADIALRHLPGLRRLAHGAAEADPLIAAIDRLATAWPLSSVGLPLVPPPAGERVGAVLGDACLTVLYAERIIASSDVARLEDAATRRAVREVVGAHPNLCPEVAAALGG